MINLCLIFFTVCKYCIMMKVKEEKHKVCQDCNIDSFRYCPLAKNHVYPLIFIFLYCLFKFFELVYIVIYLFFTYNKFFFIWKYTKIVWNKVEQWELYSSFILFYFKVLLFRESTNFFLWLKFQQKKDSILFWIILYLDLQYFSNV